MPAEPDGTPRSFHLHLVSDATGETINSVARACLVQFEGIEPVEHTWSLIRTPGQMEKVIDGIGANPGPVLFTNTSPSYVNLSVIGAEAPEESASAPGTGAGSGETTAPAGSSDVTSEATAESTESASATSDEQSAVPISEPATDADSDDGGSNTGLIIGIVVAALVVVGIVVYAVRRKSSADDRE